MIGEQSATVVPGGSNPSEPERSQETEPREGDGSDPGNVTSLHNVRTPDHPSGSSLLPVQARPTGAWWAWHPLHGGTGLSTLAKAVPGGAELDGIPAEHGWPNLPVVAVCRSHHGGLVAAQTFAKATTDNPDLANVIGLVIVADAPRPPKQLAAHIRLVSGAYPQVWRIPFVRAWRLGEPVALGNVPRQAQALFSDLAEQCDMPLNNPTTEGETTP